MKQKLRWVERGLASLWGCAGMISAHSMGFLFLLQEQLLTEVCSYFLLVARVATALAPCRIKTLLWARRDSPRSQCLEFVFDALLFDALTASPRAAGMGRGESCLMGTRGEQRGWGCNCLSCLLIFAGGGRGAPFRVSAHPDCIPLCSHGSALWEAKGMGSCGFATLWWKCCNFRSNLSFKVYFFLILKASERC